MDPCWQKEPRCHNKSTGQSSVYLFNFFDLIHVGISSILESYHETSPVDPHLWMLLPRNLLSWTLVISKSSWVNSIKIPYSLWDDDSSITAIFDSSTYTRHCLSVDFACQRHRVIHNRGKEPGMNQESKSKNGGKAPKNRGAKYVFRLFGLNLRKKTSMCWFFSGKRWLSFLETTWVDTPICDSLR